MTMLSPKQIESRLEEHYICKWGEKDTDQWYVNPADNAWRFDRYGCTITLTCNPETGYVTEEAREKHSAR